ncbi:hypothetical protein BI032_gp272 [Citrobacter phage vB_CfrM_CfP1]|uniref:Uncharacterized protein n=2 Tax=Pseudotevenvirus miller TaxID=2843956 RepID=A0A1B1IXZ6_9CAUD|nr:hypothetical protein BI032_gp272 [Citrobacter phage vB_CfrM_CfP1]ANS06193.1 hypothetical protein ABCD_0077 [Citrobacter phage vB_CfrM_CfP1]QPX73061.1 hypothetical protein [Citrobacter phage vB_Cfr_Xman]
MVPNMQPYLMGSALLVSGNRFPGMQGEVKKLPAHKLN